MKRQYLPLYKALKEARESYGYSEDYGLCACYEIENMGFCKDGVTSVNGMPSYTLKR